MLCAVVAAVAVKYVILDAGHVIFVGSLDNNPIVYFHVLLDGLRK